jgi:membrane fusion protein
MHSTLTSSISPSTASVLDPSQTAFLLHLLSGNDPQHLHFEQPLWTLEAIAEVVLDEFERQLTPAEALRCIAELGLAPADPLLALSPSERDACSHWLREQCAATPSLPARLWCVTEHELAPPLADTAVAALCHGPQRIGVISASGPQQQCVWWLCRGRIDRNTRVAMLQRLHMHSPGAVVLGCGLDAEYADAVSQLGHKAGTNALLDSRDATTGSAQNATLFRQEVLQARQRRIEGEVLVIQPVSLWALTMAIVALLLALVLVGAFGRFARTHSAPGVLMPSAGALRLEAPQSGRLARMLVAVGDRVASGQKLAEITSAQLDASGTSVDARIVEEIDNALRNLHQEAEEAQRQGTLEHQRLANALTIAERQRDDSALQYQLQQQRQRLADDNLARSRQLAQNGVIARVRLQELEQQTLDGQVQLLTLAREHNAAAAAVDEAHNRLAQQPLEAAQRLDSLNQRRTELNQRLAQARQSAGSNVYAPQSGRVAAVLQKPGETLTAGMPLVVLVDDTQPLQAQLYIPSRAVGFLRPGQEVQLKLDAFPFQSYGTLRGTLSEISHAALTPRELDTPLAGNEPVYVAHVDLGTQQMQAQGQAQALSAGMQLSAEIVIDRPRIIEWLLEPLYALRGR